MKAFTRFASIAAALLMALALCACAAPAQDASARGTYSLALVSADGEVYSAQEVYSAPSSLVLERSRAVLTLDGAEYIGKWFLQEGVFDLVTDGGVSHGTLADGVCVFDYLDSGLVHAFALDGVSVPEGLLAPASASAAALTPQQALWAGDWYGWWSISNAQGDWAALDGQWYDCFARVEFSAGGECQMTLWDEQLSYAAPMGVVSLALAGDDGGMGTASSLSGSFWLAEIGAGEWQLDPSAYGFDKLVVVDDGHYEASGGSFDYALVLRPWGAVWDDVAEALPEILPYYYDTWYLPALDAGQAMPDAFDVSAVVVPDYDENENSEE